MKIKEIMTLFEKHAPSSYQEDYDNAGLIIGNKESEITGILLALDTTEAIIQEAMEMGCNLIVAHHPIIFKGLKKINGKNYVERVVLKAIKNDINILVIHTNIDNVLKQGVSERMAMKLGLNNLQILRPKQNTLSKLVIYCPTHLTEAIKTAVFNFGGGEIGNYTQCSFKSDGKGSFKGNEKSNPKIGKKNELKEIEETKIEFLVKNNFVIQIIEAAKEVHEYEEMAYDIIPISNNNQEVGSGIIGELEEEMSQKEFLQLVKKSFNLDTFKYTPVSKNIKKVCVCGGSGSFLIKDALQNNADAYITADIKYHEFFDGEEKLLVCDIGHYESEISTLDIFYEIISEKKPIFAVNFCKTNTNPVKYYN